MPSFLNDFSSLLEEHALMDTPVIITGDFNIHWDKGDQLHTRQLKEILFSFRIEQHVNEATHIKGHILDLIILRHRDNLALSDINIEDPISDHYLILCQLLPNKPNVSSMKYVSYRKIKVVNLSELKQDILNSKIVNTYLDMDLDSLMEELDKDMTQVFNKHATLISRRCRSRRRDPWITPTVVQALERFRMCERAYMKNIIEANKTRYQSERKPMIELFIYQKRSIIGNLSVRIRQIANKCFVRLIKLCIETRITQCQITRARLN